MNLICKQLYTIIPKKISLEYQSIDCDKNKLGKHTGASRSVTEHSLGRQCAHAALAAIGVQTETIHKGLNGEPIWPASTVGSISHSKGHCFTAVARKTDFLSIGVDIEHFNRMKDRSISRITHPLELESVGTDRDLATLLFSLKEAFYKAQFPIYQRQLSFKDIALNLIPERQSADLLWANPNLPIPQENYSDWKFNFVRIKNRCYSLAYLPKKQPC